MEKLGETWIDSVLESPHEGEGQGGTEAGRRCVFSKGLALLPSLLHRKAASLKCSNLYIFVCKYSCYSSAMYSAHFTYPCTALWGSHSGGDGGLKDKKQGKKKLKASLGGDQIQHKAGQHLLPS